MMIIHGRWTVTALSVGLWLGIGRPVLEYFRRVEMVARCLSMGDAQCFAFLQDFPFHFVVVIKSSLQRCLDSMLEVQLEFKAIPQQVQAVTIQESLKIEFLQYFPQQQFLTHELTILQEKPVFIRLFFLEIEMLGQLYIYLRFKQREEGHLTIRNFCFLPLLLALYQLR